MGHIYIVDSMMGTGKTWAALNEIKGNPDRHYLYITPYLEEIENRVLPYLNETMEFVTPDNSKYGTKLRSLKSFLSQKKNIVSTHALFILFDDEVSRLLRAGDYTLIMDEVSDVVAPYQITKDDLDTLLNKYVVVEPENKLLRWRQDLSDYTGKFLPEKNLCDNGSLVLHGGVILWVFPISVFRAFRKIYILTYLFESQIQRYYFDYYGLKYSYIYVEGDTIPYYTFTEEPVKEEYVYDFKNLIHVLDNEKMNEIGRNKTALSKTWYANNKDNMEKLRKNVYNYFHNIMKSSGTRNMWTTFLDYKKTLVGKGYTRGFIALNARATNKYRDRDVLAYTVNRYMQTYVKGLFLANKIHVDEDGFALSEMLQWIWRSAIRDGKEIWIYVPSKRMRDLLKEWIADNSP